MYLSRFSAILRNSKSLGAVTESTGAQINARNVTTSATGAILQEPARTPFGMLGIICAVVPGLLIGATISKNVANFLEENELFVPSDDDDDDD